MLAPLANAFFSTQDYEEALVSQRLNEITAFLNVKDYAIRSQPAVLRMVRRQYLKMVGAEYERSPAYLSAYMARDVYEYLTAFAQQRLAGAPYEDAMPRALGTLNALSEITNLSADPKIYAENIQYCYRHLEIRRNEHDQASVTSQAMIETLYALEILEQHMDAHQLLTHGVILALHQIRDDINAAMIARTGFKKTGQDQIETPEAAFMKAVIVWLAQQEIQAQALEDEVQKKIGNVDAGDDVEDLMIRGKFFIDICKDLRYALQQGFQNGDYLGRCAVISAATPQTDPVEMTRVLHFYMNMMLKAEIKIMRADPECGPLDMQTFAEAYDVLMRGIDARFPSKKPRQMPLQIMTMPVPH